MPYHVFVAARNSSNKKQFNGALAMVVFWLVFIIVTFSIFSYNSEIIKKNFNIFKERLADPSSADKESFLSDDDSFVDVVIEPRETSPEGQIPQSNIPQTQDTTQNTSPSVVKTPETVVTAPETRSQETAPASQPAPSTQTTPAQTQTTTQTQAQPVPMRDRAIYFTQVNSDGQILQSKVTRRLPVTQSPMMDALNVLLAGLTAEELSRGLINLIPANTRIISATVRGNTAYINFSEDFLFNTFGVDGYVAQLRQIVWTVTEFSNVNDVQVLIEGMRYDYLGEGIWIGSPISRQSF